MADNQRIDDLRRRVQRDPASIAFAQLAEELRRAGQMPEAVETCRAGLQIHPAYLSARVTLGRALLELNELPDAQAELEYVLKSAPENLAAIRGLGEIHHRRGELPEALAQYRAALALARNDPDLQETVDQLSRQVEPQKPAVADDGLSFDQIQSELLKLAPVPQTPTPSDSASSPLPWEVVLQAPGVQSEPPVDQQPDANSSVGQEENSGGEQTQPLRLDEVDAELSPPLPSPDVHLEDAGSAELAASLPSPEAHLDETGLAEFATPLSTPTANLEDPGAAAFAPPLPSPDVHLEDAGLADFAASLSPDEHLDDAEAAAAIAALLPPPDEDLHFARVAECPSLPSQDALLEDVGAALAEPSTELAAGPMVSEDPKRDHAERTVAALEQWLAAIHVARPERSA